MRRFVSVFLFVLIACGGGEAPLPQEAAPAAEPATVETAASATETTSSAEPVPASTCALLTPEEILTVTGRIMAPGEALSTASPSQCTWSTAEGEKGSVSLTLYEGSQAEGAWSSFQAMGGNPLAGVGTDALWNENSRSVTIRKGERTANVTFDLPEPQPEWPTAIATVVAEKM